LHDRRHFTGKFSRQIAKCSDARAAVGIDLSACVPRFAPSRLQRIQRIADAMILNDVPTYPGILVRCRPIGMVELVQRESGGKAELNNRIVLLPQWRDAHLEEASDLPGEVRAQVENFFVSTAKFTNKQVRIKGWASARKAMRFIDAHHRKR
jgi:inorganic pyrophosphatase